MLAPDRSAPVSSPKQTEINVLHCVTKFKFGQIAGKRYTISFFNYRCKYRDFGVGADNRCYWSEVGLQDGKCSGDGNVLTLRDRSPVPFAG